MKKKIYHPYAHQGFSWCFFFFSTWKWYPCKSKYIAPGLPTSAYWLDSYIQGKHSGAGISNVYLLPRYARRWMLDVYHKWWSYVIKAFWYSSYTFHMTGMPLTYTHIGTLEENKHFPRTSPQKWTIPRMKARLLYPLTGARIKEPTGL